MGIGRPSLRLLAVLLTAALPPLVAFGVLSLAQPTWMARVGSPLSVLILVGAAVLWIALVAVVAARPMADDARSIAALAERGMASTGDGLSSAQRRLATTLEDRNRQISDLADLIRVAPISKDATSVAHAMVAGARQVTGDPTWLLAILRVPGDQGPGAGRLRADRRVRAGDPGRGASLGSDGRGARSRPARRPPGRRPVGRLHHRGRRRRGRAAGDPARSRGRAAGSVAGRAEPLRRLSASTRPRRSITPFCTAGYASRPRS